DPGCAPSHHQPAGLSGKRSHPRARSRRQRLLPPPQENHGARFHPGTGRYRAPAEAYRKISRSEGKRASPEIPHSTQEKFLGHKGRRRSTEDTERNPETQTSDVTSTPAKHYENLPHLVSTFSLCVSLCAH